MHLDNKYPEVLKAIKEFQKKMWDCKYAGNPEVTIESETYQHNRKDKLLPETHIAQNIVIKFRVFDKGEFNEEDE